MPTAARDAQRCIAPRTASLLVFAVSLSVLVFEVALTRAFSVLLRYHFVFLAISLATCGLGLGGLIDFLLRLFVPRIARTQAFVSGLCLVLAFSYPLSLALLFATPLSAHLTSLAVVSLTCLLPFLLAGILLSHMFTEYSAFSGRLYFSDLSGAALGTVLVIAFLQWGGAVNTAVVCGIIVAAGLAVNMAAERNRAGAVMGGVVLLVIAGALVGNVSRRVVDLPRLPMKNDPLAKPLYQELNDPRVKLEYSEWDAFARTDVTVEADADGVLRPTSDRYIYTDGEVPTNMLAFDGDLGKLKPRLSRFIGLFPFRMQRPDSCLLIGPGGGLDVLLALMVGTRHIEGVELNPAIPRIVRRYRDFAGPVYDYANVSIKVDEGRSYVRRSQKQYDLIYMALTKTATTASTSLALVESYAHTVEAFGDYYDHLSADGCLAFVCQSNLVLLRTFLTALEALQERGIARAEALDHLAVISVQRRFYGRGPYRHLLLMFRKPLEPERSAYLARQAIALGFEPGYFPGAFEPQPFSWLTEERLSTPEFVARFSGEMWRASGLHVNLVPCTDDKPFVFDFTYGIPRQFKWLVGVVGAAVVVLAILAGMVLLRLPSFGASLRPVGCAFLYFALLGAGFMLVEVCLVQKLIQYLGYPVLALSVILFALLLGSGSGSYVSQAYRPRALMRWAALAALVVTGLVVGLEALLPAVIDATLHWQILARCVLTMLLLFGLGFFMGMPFPIGLRIVGQWHEMVIPWVWGLNGLTSVLGSVGAMTLAKLFGFSVVLMVGAAIYLVAAVAVLLTGTAGTSVDGKGAGGRLSDR